MPYRRAEPLYESKRIDEANGRDRRIIWEVPRDSRNPDGLKYRPVYIPAGWKEPAVLYDNHFPKGHHKHIAGREVAYEFTGFDDLIRDFEKDIEAFR